jgi:hypothetical protein
MNGFIRKTQHGMLLLAAVIPAGCQSLPTIAGSPNGHEVVVQEHAVHSGSCNNEGCSHCGNLCGRLKEKLRDFDYEQLHPDHCWPEQYTRESVRRTREPFGQQVANGTAIEVTIWEHYFKREEGMEHELNRAGEERIRYLARKRPYVIPELQLQTSFNQERDQKRIETILAKAREVTLEPESWQVTVVNRAPTGLSGKDGANQVKKMFGDTTPAPMPQYEQYIKSSFRQAATQR